MFQYFQEKIVISTWWKFEFSAFSIFLGFSRNIFHICMSYDISNIHFHVHDVYWKCNKVWRSCRNIDKRIGIDYSIEEFEEFQELFDSGRKVKSWRTNIFVSVQAHKYCESNGTWFRHPVSDQVWSNYTTCVNLQDLSVSEAAKMFILYVTFYVMLFGNAMNVSL